MPKNFGVFEYKKPELSISEIAKKLDLNKSNVHNMISTFCTAGYVEKNPVSDKYILSNKLLEFSYVVTSRLSYQHIILPIMQNLSNELEHVVYFGVPHDTFVLYMFTTNLTYRSVIGEKAPLYCTSLGKAMLYTMTKEEVQSRIQGVRERFTPKTLMSEKEILQDLHISRERGYAIENIEHEQNIRCIGVPVINGRLSLIGGISISGSAQQITLKKVPYIAQKLSAAAYEIRRSI